MARFPRSKKKTTVRWQNCYWLKFLLPLKLWNAEISPVLTQVIYKTLTPIIPTSWLRYCMLLQILYRSVSKLHRMPNVPGWNSTVRNVHCLVRNDHISWKDKEKPHDIVVTTMRKIKLRVWPKPYKLTGLKNHFGKKSSVQRPNNPFLLQLVVWLDLNLLLACGETTFHKY